MDDSSDRARLLYKLITPSLSIQHPPAKGQSHSHSDSADTCTHTRVYMQSPAAMDFLRSNPNGGSVPMCKQSRRTAAKCKKRMTQPRSLVRLFVMISLILLICSVSYQAVQAGLLQSRLLKKKKKKKKKSYMHFK